MTLPARRSRTTYEVGRSPSPSRWSRSCWSAPGGRTVPGRADPPAEVQPGWRTHHDRRQPIPAGRRERALRAGRRGGLSTDGRSACRSAGFGYYVGVPWRLDRSAEAAPGRGFVAFEVARGPARPPRSGCSPTGCGVTTLRSPRPRARATALGGGRALVLDADSGVAASPRAEALLFAADRAHHVTRYPAGPGWRPGVLNRSVRGFLARVQAPVGRLPVEEVRRLSQWPLGAAARADRAARPRPEIGVRRSTPAPRPTGSSRSRGLPSAGATGVSGIWRASPDRLPSLLSADAPARRFRSRYVAAVGVARATVACPG